MTDRLTADLVVVGSGGAGLPAALTAQQNGLPHVVVLEKRPVVGGNAGMSGGYLFAIDSEPQRRQGGGGNSADRFFRETMSYYHYDGVDPRLIRLWVDEADRTIDWIEKHLGIGYRVWPGNPLAVEPSGWSNTPGTFQRVMEIMAERCAEQGGEVLTRTPATSIEPDGEGGYRVHAKGPGGEITIDTPRVLLASGGFTGDVDRLHGEFPGVYDEQIYWTDTKRLAGDGIRLAEQVGGDTSGRTFLIKENCYSFKTKKNKPNRAGYDSPLWVNKYGERFLDESLGPVNAATNNLVTQPGMAGYALFDDALVEEMMQKRSYAGVEPRPGEDDPTAWTADGFRRNFRDELSDPSNAEWSIRADSWEEIAEWIGADPAVLKATVEEYNRFCEQGRDELWGKPAELLIPLVKPPFYALKFRPLMIDTAGPVRVDRELHLVDAGSQPVPGVFVAGALLSGWIGNDEHRFGTPLSWAISSGRIAGEHAAAYIPAADRARAASA